MVLEPYTFPRRYTLAARATPFDRPSHFEPEPTETAMDRTDPSARITRAARIPAFAALALSALFWLVGGSAPVHAQGENYTFSAGLLGTIGGSQDAEPGDELDNKGLQVNLGVVTRQAEHLVVRVGRLGLDSADRFEDLTDADLTYATVGGEYRYRHPYYDSGVYLALGAYRLEGNDVFTGEGRDDTALGLALGATGEFPINPRLAVQAEISGHYADLDSAQIFVMGGVGLVVHF